MPALNPCSLPPTCAFWFIIIFFKHPGLKAPALYLITQGQCHSFLKGMQVFQRTPGRKDYCRMLLKRTDLPIVDKVVADHTVSEGFQPPGQPCSLKDSVEGNYPKDNTRERNKSISINKATAGTGAGRVSSDLPGLFQTTQESLGNTSSIISSRCSLRKQMPCLLLLLIFFTSFVEISLCLTPRCSLLCQVGPQTVPWPKRLILGAARAACVFSMYDAFCSRMDMRMASPVWDHTQWHRLVNCH